MSTVVEIKKQMTDLWIGNDNVIAKYELEAGKTFEEQFSPVSIESILFYVIAFVHWTREQLFATHKTEVETIVAEKVPHSENWYVQLAKNFRYGYALLPDSDKYSDEAIADEAAAIIAYASAKRVGNVLKIKVAKDVDNGLASLSNQEYAAFVEYMLRTMDAGVNIEFVSLEADYLKLNIDIYYNPLVLNANGVRLDGNGDTTLQDAIKAYLQNLPFNGNFDLTSLTDNIQRVEGVEIPRVLGAEVKWANYDWQAVVNKYNPEAGWLKIYDENDLVISWHANISD